MSAEADQAREIAERIARRVSGSPAPGRIQPKSEVTSELAEGLNELQRKIAQLEAKVSSGSVQPVGPASARNESVESPNSGLATHSPWLAGINTTYSHPSQEKFGVEEATVTELVDYFEKEKLCNVEPGGKPCDHCAMCSSRGF